MAANFDTKEISPPSIEEQQAYLAKQKAKRDARLTEDFTRNHHDELTARVQLFNHIDREANRHQASVTFVPIEIRNEFGEPCLGERFETSDAKLLPKYPRQRVARR